MLNDKLDALLLFGLEPDKDFPGGRDVVENLSQHRFVVAFTPYKTYALETCADLLLPIGSFAETLGTYVNCEGRWDIELEDLADDLVTKSLRVLFESESDCAIFVEEVSLKGLPLAAKG